MEILVKFVLCRHFKVNFAESCKTGSFVLRTKKVTPDFTKIQLYPLSTYILPNGVFSSIPFLLYILSNGVFSFIPFLYKWTRLIFTEPLLAVAAQTRPGGSAVCARQDRGFLSMDKPHLYTTPLISRRADPSRRVCGLRERR